MVFKNVQKKNENLNVLLPYVTIKKIKLNKK